MKRLKRENAELKRANGILGFLRGRTRPATALIVRFIDEHVGDRPDDGLRWGVEAICHQLTELGCKIAPATYYAPFPLANSPRGQGWRTHAESREGARGQLRRLRRAQSLATTQP